MEQSSKLLFVVIVLLLTSAVTITTMRIIARHWFAEKLKFINSIQPKEKGEVLHGDTSTTAGAESRGSENAGTDTANASRRKLRSDAG